MQVKEAPWLKEKAQSYWEPKLPEAHDFAVDAHAESQNQNLISSVDLTVHWKVNYSGLLQSR